MEMYDNGLIHYSIARLLLSMPRLGVNNGVNVAEISHQPTMTKTTAVDHPQNFDGLVVTLRWAIEANIIHTIKSDSDS
ncbi:hypothetical protein PC118_g5327 [Phytophthora cactorum]|uniref:Uncharacterized protein n=1 Tax=Phytophthora cactorum TaxID=29920 RepID=A0A8T1G8K4_9STRA|nr:hypothetical protein PC118_g5327 [Phytophthora cactorum]